MCGRKEINKDRDGKCNGGANKKWVERWQEKEKEESEMEKLRVLGIKTEEV